MKVTKTVETRKEYLERIAKDIKFAKKFFKDNHLGLTIKDKDGNILLYTYYNKKKWLGSSAREKIKMMEDTKQGQSVSPELNYEMKKYSKM